MSTQYHIEVWQKAVRDAEFDVMRTTAIPSGGRKQDESLMDYVDRVHRLQRGALAHYTTAKAELAAATQLVKI